MTDNDQPRYNRPVDFDEEKIWDDDDAHGALMLVVWIVAAGILTVLGLVALVMFL